MNKDYDVVSETLLPTLTPTIQAFGLPQQAVNEIVNARHKQAASMGLGSALGLGSLASSGLAYMMGIAPKARDAASAAVSTGSAVFGRAIRDSAPGVSKLISKSDASTPTALKEFAGLASDSDHLVKMLRTPSARATMPAAVIDHLLSNSTERDALFRAARSAALVDAHPDLFAGVAMDAVDTAKNMVDLHPVTIAGSIIGAGSIAAGIYDAVTPPKREPEPWYRGQGAAAVGAGAIGAALGAGGLYAASTYQGRQSVLGPQASNIKSAGIVATGLGMLGTAAQHANARGAASRFAGEAVDAFPGLSPDQLEQIATAYEASKNNGVMGRITRGLAGATAVASGAGAIHNYQLKQENDRQRKEFDRKLPAMVAGATGAGVVLGGVGGRLADRAVTQAVSRGREYASRPISV